MKMKKTLKEWLILRKTENPKKIDKYNTIRLKNNYNCEEAINICNILNIEPEDVIWDD